MYIKHTKIFDGHSMDLSIWESEIINDSIFYINKNWLKLGKFLLLMEIKSENHLHVNRTSY